LVVDHDGTERPLFDLINQSEIIVNGLLQEPDHPIFFMTEDEISYLKPGCLIIDISCDEGMGFFFAKPTTFKNPIFKIGKADYYAVDHTPSYLWESASRCISAALIVHLPTVLAGYESWQQSETIRQAVNIDAGVIQKRDIISFQNREAFYPHAPINIEGN
jgi:N5-(carboxyethyl)ornithine synthase